MCLFNHNAKLNVANEDITCYKVVLLDMGDFRPFFRTANIIREEVIKGAEPYVADGEAEPTIRSDGWVKWGAGLVHSFIEFETTVHLEFSNSMVYECVIPKDTEFTIGFDSQGYKCLASKKMVFKKRLYDGRYRC